MDAKQLLQRAENAASGAYAPYSGEPKGAALLCSDGSVYASGNVEFATFGGSVCADLAVLTRAVTDGKRDFKMLASFPHRFPCGNCRQYLAEFGLELQVVTQTAEGGMVSRSLADLLPNSFGKSNLERTVVDA